MNDDSRLTFDHARKESAVQANGGEQVDLQYSLPVLVGEHFESACFCFCSTDIIHQDVEPARGGRCRPGMVAAAPFDPWGSHPESVEVK